MHALVLLIKHTKLLIPSITYSKDTIGTPKFK